MIKQYLIKAIKSYQNNISPFLSKTGFHCIYKQTCSEYAISCFESFKPSKALILTCVRILSCNPINHYIKLQKFNNSI